MSSQRAYGVGEFPRCMCPSNPGKQKLCCDFQKATREQRCMFQKPDTDICDWHPDYHCVKNPGYKPNPNPRSAPGSGWGPSYQFKQTQGAGAKQLTEKQKDRVEEMKKIIDAINNRTSYK